jgi:hypothetical protein
VGSHHFNFLVTDIEDTLTLIKASGIEPVGVNLANPDWKEAFLHRGVSRLAGHSGSQARHYARATPEPRSCAVSDTTSSSLPTRRGRCRGLGAVEWRSDHALTQPSRPKARQSYQIIGRQ